MNLETLRNLHEADAPAKRLYSFPHELVDDPSLNTSQKRAMLAEWASDACAIESFPTLRLLPGTTFPVTLSSIMDAFAQLDRIYDAENEISDLDVAQSRQLTTREGSAGANKNVLSPYPSASRLPKNGSRELPSFGGG